MKRCDVIKRLAASGAALAWPAFAETNRIVRGRSAAFTRPAAQPGIQMNASARIYFNGVNAAGGINGNPVELRTLDDGYEPDRCQTNTDKCFKDDVFGPLGCVGTPTLLVALPLVVNSKTPFFGPKEYVTWRFDDPAMLTDGGRFTADPASRMRALPAAPRICPENRRSAC